MLYKLLYQASHGEIVLPRPCGLQCCMPLPATSISALRFGLSVVQRLLTLKEFQMCILDLVLGGRIPISASLAAPFFFCIWSYAADPVIGSRVWPDVFQV